VKEVILPYATASQTTWRLGDWHLGPIERERHLPARIEDWDATVDVDLQCEIELDVTALRRQCHLSPDAGVRLICAWHASSTGIRRIAARWRLGRGGAATVRAQFVVPGRLIGGTLTLERLVVLTQPTKSPPAGTADKPGSVLLREEASARREAILEGEAARFPTEVVDFAAIPIAEPDALWHLEMSLDDLDQSPLNAMTLYINRSHRAIAEALDAGSASGAMIRSVMQWDVARRLVRTAILTDEFVNSWGNFAEDSLGDVLEGMVRRYWPGETAASLRERFLADEGRFEYQLQARTRLLETTLRN
jgi:hypothetical protein